MLTDIQNTFASIEYSLLSILWLYMAICLGNSFMSCTMDKSTQPNIAPNSSSDKQQIQLQDRNVCLLDAKLLLGHG